MKLIAKSGRIEEVDPGNEPALIKFLNGDGLRQEARGGVLDERAGGAAIDVYSTVNEALQVRNWV